MVYKIETLKNNDDCRTNLKTLLDSDKNPISCANYGNGNHCDNPARTELKCSMWGPRGEKNGNEACMTAKVLFLDEEPIAFFNIGVTENPPTVIDKSHEQNGQVYEMSGFFVKDEYTSEEGLKIIGNFAQNIFSCTPSPDFTKIFVTFSPNHPYQEELFSNLGGIKLTKDNYTKQLGENSMSAAKYKFDESGTLLENGVEKIAVVFDIVAGNIAHQHDDL